MAQVPIQTAPTQELSASQLGMFQAPGVDPMQDFSGKQAEALGKATEQTGLAAVKIGQKMEDDYNDSVVADVMVGLSGQFTGIHTKFKEAKLKDAVAGYSAAKDQVLKAYEDSLAGLNDTQKALVKAKAQPLISATFNSMTAHSMEQSSALNKATAKSNMLVAVDQNIRTKPGSPENLAAQTASLHWAEVYAASEGIPLTDDNGKETAAFTLIKQQSIFDPVASSRVKSMLADGQFAEAKTFLASQKGLISPEVHDALNASVTEGATQVQAENIAKGMVEGKVETGVTFVSPIPAGYKVTSDFGTRVAPMRGASTNHKGIDLAAAKGSSVASVGAGTVIATGTNAKSGNYIQVKLNNGYVASFAHLDKINVAAGQAIEQGAVIGTVGSTGTATGPHLHFGLRDEKGNAVDPAPFLSGKPAGGGGVQAPVNFATAYAQAERIKNPVLRAKVLAQLGQRQQVRNQQDEDIARRMIQVWYEGDISSYMVQHPGEVSRLASFKPDLLDQMRSGTRPNHDKVDTVIGFMTGNIALTPQNLELNRYNLSTDTYIRFKTALNRPDARKAVEADGTMFNAIVPQYYNNAVYGTDEASKKLRVKINFAWQNSIDEWQIAAGGKTAPREVKEKLLREILNDSVYISSNFGDKAVRYIGLPDTAAAGAYIKLNNGVRISLSSIPLADMNRIKTTLRQKGVHASPVNIVTEYVKLHPEASTPKTTKAWELH